MIEGRYCPSFPLETGLQFGAGREMRRKNLDCDRSLQTGVASAIDFTHPARAERGLNLIGPEIGARGESHRVCGIIAHAWYLPGRIMSSRRFGRNRHDKSWIQLGSNLPNEKNGGFRDSGLACETHAVLTQLIFVVVAKSNQRLRTIPAKAVLSQTTSARYSWRCRRHMLIPLEDRWGLLSVLEQEHGAREALIRLYASGDLKFSCTP